MSVANTMWYLQFHLVCAKLLLSIWITSFDLVLAVGEPAIYSIIGGFLFLSISRTFSGSPA